MYTKTFTTLIFIFFISFLLSCSKDDPLADNEGEWLIPESEIRLGCSTGRDCIPSLNDPATIDANDAFFLKDDDLVIGVTINGEAVAYQLNVLDWHEVINHKVGGESIVISYCPLTASGYAFSSRINGALHSFGVSGLLYNNNLIMYDRLTGSNYAQLFFKGVNGSNIGTHLTPVNYVESTWKLWKQLFPNTKVLSRSTGFNRNYDQYPYGYYWTNNNNLIFPISHDDPRMARKARVLGIYHGDKAKAFPLAGMGRSGAQVLNETVGAQPIVIAAYGSGNKGAEFAIAFDRRVDDQILTFSESANTFPFRMRDNETNTLWNLQGEAISGPLKGKKLTQANGFNAFWFAWAAFYPKTDIR